MKFKVGDKVRIQPHTQYSNQCNLNGEIYAIGIDDDMPLNVVFKNGYKNCYGEIDLELVVPKIRKKLNPEEMIL